MPLPLPSLWRPLMVGTLLVSSTASAAPPLMPAAEVAGSALEVYAKPGELLVVQPTPAGDRVALHPLSKEPSSPAPAPRDLAGHTRVGAGTCPKSPPSFRWSHGEAKASVQAAGPWDAPVVELTIDGERVATAALGRAAHVCALYAANLDALPGEEVVVVWRVSREDTATHGVTVLRVPATAW